MFLEESEEFIAVFKIVVSRSQMASAARDRCLLDAGSKLEAWYRLPGSASKFVWVCV